MSIKMMSQVFCSNLKATEKLVMLAIADCSNDEGHCWPSLDKLAAKCSMTATGVSRIISRLEERGLLTKNKRFGRSTIYTVSTLDQNCTRVDTVSTAEQVQFQSRVERIYEPSIEPSIEPSYYRGAFGLNDGGETGVAEAVAVRQKKTRRKPLTEFPTGWRPNDEHRKKCKQLGYDVDRLAEQFENNHRSKANRFADWDRAFNTWIGNAERFGAERGGCANNKQSDPSITQAGLRVAARYQGKH